MLFNKDFLWFWSIIIFIITTAMTMGLMYILPFDYIESGIAVISGLIGLQIYTIVFYFKFKDKE